MFALLIVALDKPIDVLFNLKPLFIIISMNLITSYILLFNRTLTLTSDAWFTSYVKLFTMLSYVYVFCYKDYNMPSECNAMFLLGYGVNIRY